MPNLLHADAADQQRIQLRQARGADTAVSEGCDPLLGARWPEALVAERMDALTLDDREALLRYGHRRAHWESVPDAARRILVCDPKVSLEDVRVIDAVFRAAYAELAR